MFQHQCRSSGRFHALNVPLQTLKRLHLPLRSHVGLLRHHRRPPLLAKFYRCYRACRISILILLLVLADAFSQIWSELPLRLIPSAAYTSNRIADFFRVLPEFPSLMTFLTRFIIRSVTMFLMPFSPPPDFLHFCYLFLLGFFIYLFSLIRSISAYAL